MKQSDLIEQAKGYIKGMKTAIKIINKIDFEHPEYKMPMEIRNCVAITGSKGARA